jgi:tetratricopeptide (TPR) repeat protein
MNKICYSIMILLIITTGVIAGELEILKENADKYWKKRDIQEDLLTCINLYEKALKQSPEDENILLRLSIAYFWKGNHTEKGWFNNKKMNAYESGKAYAAQLCQLKPESIEGNFWHATNDAAYINEKRIKLSKSVINDAKKRNLYVMSHAKYYYHGGPQRLGAKIIMGIPSFVRNEDESLSVAEKYLKDAIRNYPNFTLSHIFLSELYMKMEKKDLAKQSLKQVLAIHANSVPQFAPENRRDKKEAKKRLLELN